MCDESVSSGSRSIAIVVNLIKSEGDEFFVYFKFTFLLTLFRIIEILNLNSECTTKNGSNSLAANFHTRRILGIFNQVSRNSS